MTGAASAKAGRARYSIDAPAEPSARQRFAASSVYFSVRPHPLNIRRILRRTSAEFELKLARVFSLARHRGLNLWISQRAPPAVGVLLACVFVVSSAFAGEPDTRVRTEDIMFQDLNLHHYRWRGCALPAHSFGCTTRVR